MTFGMTCCERNSINRKHKGFEMPLNTLVAMVVVLLMVIVVLSILVSGACSNYSDILSGKMRPSTD